jgi:serine/threonine-protein kinase
LWLGIAAIAVAAVGSTLVFRDLLFKPDVPADSARRSIAVLPFEDVSRARDQEYFGTGIADELLSALSRLPNVRVAARTSSFALRGSNLSPGDIGRRLRVSSLLTGSVRREGERLRVVAELVDIGPDTVLWHGVFDRQASDVFAVQEDIARAIAREFQAPVSDSAELLKRSTRDPEAYQLYLRGRHGWRTRTAQSLAQAVNYFQQAIALDSNYASAHAGLADTYNAIGLNLYGPAGENFRRAREAAERAIALDPQLAEAHSALGAAIAFLDRDWDRAEDAFKRAIALDPSYPPSYYFYSIFLSNLGRHDSALTIATRARDLDATSAVMWQGIGIARVNAAQFPQAVSALEATIAIDPSYYFPHAWYSIALARTGKPDSALAEVHRAMRMAPQNVLVRAFHGQVHALVGQRDSATAIARGLEALQGVQAIPNVMVARLYAIMGDTTNALAALERGLVENEAQLAQLRVPGFETLYLHPRFEAILRQLKLN